MAVQRAWDFNEGWFANPTFINGDYPTYLKEFVSDFLPDFTDDEKQMINGTADIFAHDAYTSQFYFGTYSFPIVYSTRSFFSLKTCRQLFLIYTSQHRTQESTLVLKTNLTHFTHLAPTQAIPTHRTPGAGTLARRRIPSHHGCTKQPTGSLHFFTTSRTPGNQPVESP
jgi:hypothetical protein